MADDASLERSLARFLADAAPLRSGRGFDPVRSFQLLSAAEFDGDASLCSPLDEARRVGIAAVAAPTDRNAAIARYALERVAIAVEGRVRSAVSVEAQSLRRGQR